MLRVLVCTVLMRTLYTVCFFLQFVAFLHAEPASVWSYKGSVLALSQSESNVIITYQTLSDALTKSGAHVGDPAVPGTAHRQFAAWQSLSILWPHDASR